MTKFPCCQGRASDVIRSMIAKNISLGFDRFCCIYCNRELALEAGDLVPVTNAMRAEWLAQEIESECFDG